MDVSTVSTDLPLPTRPRRTTANYGRVKAPDDQGVRRRDKHRRRESEVVDEDGESGSSEDEEEDAQEPAVDHARVVSTHKSAVFKHLVSNPQCLQLYDDSCFSVVPAMLVVSSTLRIRSHVYS